MSQQKLPCFKAYDVRGRIPDELNEDLVFSIGQAYAAVFDPKQVVVGQDIRLTSATFANALIDGLTSCGVNISRIGLCGTEEIYFATSHINADGGIMVTASHNPHDYNGLKFVKKGSRPISGDSGLPQIEAATIAKKKRSSVAKGKVKQINIRLAYVEHLLGYVEIEKLSPFKIVANSGNGCAGPIIDALEPYLPFEFIKIHHTPDGTFPNGIPNPLLPENRPPTVNAVKSASANLGLAWDGDFDRCFLFDETGHFIEGYYIVGLLASQSLRKNHGAKIIHDPRLTWNTIDLVKKAGGIPVQSKSGHAFIKEKMREQDAVYGGEMSAHHYFKNFAYCDSGMIPWLLVTEAMSQSGKKLSQLVKERMEMFPVSGEINRKVEDPASVIAKAKAYYGPKAQFIDETDGVSIEFDNWRFNLRKSNTESVIRLNVEARNSQKLMEEKTQELLHFLDNG